MHLGHLLQISVSNFVKSLGCWQLGCLCGAPSLQLLCEHSPETGETDIGQSLVKYQDMACYAPHLPGPGD